MKWQPLSYKLLFNVCRVVFCFLFFVFCGFWVFFFFFFWGGGGGGGGVGVVFTLWSYEIYKKEHYDMVELAVPVTIHICTMHEKSCVDLHNARTFLNKVPIRTSHNHDNEVTELLSIWISSHCNKVAFKVSRTLGIMKRFKHELPSIILKLVHDPFIMSHFQYCIMGSFLLSSVQTSGTCYENCYFKQI